MERFFVSRALAVVVASILALSLAACGGGGGTGGGGLVTCMVGSPLPSAPTITTVTPGNASATVSWTTSGIDSSFVITSTPGNITVNVPGTASSGVVTGLTNGTSYTFTVTAYACAGGSPPSAPSSPVTPLAPPAAPTGVSAAPGAKVASASVSFTPPAPAAATSAPTGYIVTSSPGNITATGTASPIVVSGLPNGTYTFTVVAASLTGNSPSSVPSNGVTVNIAYTGPFYVNGSTGSDTNNGASATPFKTISQGLYVAKAVGSPNTVNVAAGAYGTGETFPLAMPNNVSLIGTSGSAVTSVSGSGWYTDSTGKRYVTALVFPPSVTATVSGVSALGAGGTVAVADNAASATIVYSSLVGAGNSADGMRVVGTSSVTLTGNAISGGCATYGGLAVAGHSTITARGNSFSDTCNPAILVLGTGTAATSPVVDLGTSGSPGGNTILGPGVIGGSAGNVGLNVSEAANWVYASGNTWHPSVQGASVTGTYAPAAVTTTTPLAIGNNYAISYAIGTGSTGIQF